MLSKVTSRISPATVIATIALFAALGGGYATAFSGSGTLQKATVAEVGPSFESIRTLNGLGVLRARCDPSQGNEAEFEFKNTRTEQSEAVVVKEVRDVDGDAARTPVPSGETQVLGLGSGSHLGTVRMHIFRLGFFNNPAGKAQVDLVVSNEGFETQCAQQGTNIWVMALNTVE